MRRLTGALVAAVLVAGACATPEEKLFDKRHELRALLGDMHGKFAQDAGAGADAGGGEADILSRLASTLERSHFEQYCLAVGRGERPFSLSGRLESFMRREDHVQECRHAAELQAEIEELERRVSERSRR